MDLKRLRSSIDKTWDDSITERLIAYVRIPNKSPMFDPQWQQHGHMETGRHAHGGAGVARSPCPERAWKCAACRG